MPKKSKGRQNKGKISFRNLLKNGLVFFLVDFDNGYCCLKVKFVTKLCCNT